MGQEVIKDAQDREHIVASCLSPSRPVCFHASAPNRFITGLLKGEIYVFGLSSSRY